MSTRFLAAAAMSYRHRPIGFFPQFPRPVVDTIGDWTPNTVGCRCNYSSSWLVQLWEMVLFFNGQGCAELRAPITASSDIETAYCWSTLLLESLVIPCRPSRSVSKAIGKRGGPFFDSSLVILPRRYSTPPQLDISEAISRRFPHTLWSTGVCPGAHDPDVDVPRSRAQAPQVASRARLESRIPDRWYSRSFRHSFRSSVGAPGAFARNQPAIGHGERFVVSLQVGGAGRRCRKSAHGLVHLRRLLTGLGNIFH